MSTRKTKQEPLWIPSESQRQQSSLKKFAAFTKKFHGQDCVDYSALHHWSISKQGEFYDSLWDFLEIIGDKGTQIFTLNDDIRKVRYFTDARLNYAENLLQHADERVAIIAHSDNGSRRSITRKELYGQVSRLVQALKADGVTVGDRVAAIVTNDNEAIVGYLATASIGAVWASCSPDFGAAAACDRLCQVRPKILLAVPNYDYAGKHYDISPTIKAVAKACKLTRVILTESPTEASADDFSFTTLDVYLAPFAIQTIPFERLGYDAPLVILFSSGTTGKPKGIIHSAMGLLLQHKKEQALHCDIKTNERFFYFTTCGWMMWNWLVSGLALEATLVLYDGNPVYPQPARLLDLIDDEKIDVFGTSAKYIDACRNTELEPKQSHKLERLRLILSTGSPLVASSFDYLYQSWKDKIQVASISGGTDICGCFLGGNPLLPVYKGQLQCSLLGMDVDVFDETGHSVTGVSGELVCKTAHISMPLGFWNDDDGARYQQAYFSRFPGVWAHGDFVEKCSSGAYIIHGRSDTTLNPGGIRIGTAEIYRLVNAIEEVAESVAVGQDWLGDQRIILFVKLHGESILNENLIAKIKYQIRNGATPRHVPAKIIAIAAIPTTRSGKVSEVAVREIIHGRVFKNTSSLANPTCLTQYENIPALVE